MAKKTILVATREITGGTKTSKGILSATLKAHEELTSDRKKALGLDDDDVKSLVGSGAIIEIPAHVSDEGSAGDSAALKAAIARAEKAEGELATANEKITELETKLTAAQAAAAK